MQPAIVIKGLSKSYKTKNNPTKIALEKIDLVVPKGSFFGLLGPNGAGKSTIINILAGLTLKDEGVCAIEGLDIDNQPLQARKFIGVVPQELILDPFFTVRETLEIYAGYYGIPRKDRRTDEILEALSLTDKANSGPRTLSGGMRRRLLIAKALVHNPPVVILDEPTAGVDVELRDQLWDYIKKINKLGTTILLTTHYLEEAETLCDIIAIIDHGHIIAASPKKNLLETINQKSIIITTIQSFDHYAHLIQNILPVVQISSHSFSLQFQSTSSSINELLNHLVAHHIPIRDISTKEPKLEDVFRFLLKSQYSGQQ